MILRRSPFKIVSVSAVLYPRWPPLLKIEISSNNQNCSILSQNVPKFELYKHNDELFNIYYGICLWTLNFCLFWPIMQIKKRGMKLKKNLLLWNYWANLNQTLLSDLWVVPFQDWIHHFRPPTEMATTAELNFTLDPMENSDKNLLVWNHLLNQSESRLDNGVVSINLSRTFLPESDTF